jgi:ABC-type multidrug transport system ATPase subunit
MHERPHYTGSTLFPDEVEPVADSLADDSKYENQFRDWNVAVLIYCSQDFFIGDRPNAINDTWGNQLNFQGSLILYDWMEELASENMVNATDILLAGSSAGGYGLMYNYQSIMTILQSHGVSADISVMLDSCFVDIPEWSNLAPFFELYLSDYNDSICSVIYKGQSCCIQPDCMITTTMAGAKILGVTGIYDWIGWAYLSPPDYPPRIDYFDNYAVRVSGMMFETTSKSPLFSSYITQCYRHQYMNLIDITTLYCDWILENENLLYKSGSYTRGFIWTIDCADRKNPRYVYSNDFLKLSMKTESLWDVPYVDNLTIRLAVNEWLSQGGDSKEERYSWFDDSCSGLSCNCYTDYEFIVTVTNTKIFDVFLTMFWVVFCIWVCLTLTIRIRLNSLKGKMLKELPGVSTQSSLPLHPIIEPIVTCKGLSFSFGNITILKNVNVELKGGAFNAIIGRTGSGKSSFAKLIVGRWSQTSGSISLNNDPVHKNILKHISSFLHQHQLNYIEQLTVLENLICSIYVRTRLPEEEIMRKIGTVCENVDLNFLLDRNTASLSGGQRKLMGIAIELLTDPKILVLDEITSGLDAAMALSIMRTTKNTITKEKLVCLVVIHQPRMKIWKLFDNILVCHNMCVYPMERWAIENAVRSFNRGQNSINIADFLIDMLHKEYKSSRRNTPTENNTKHTSVTQQAKNIIINFKGRLSPRAKSAKDPSKPSANITRFSSDNAKFPSGVLNNDRPKLVPTLSDTWSLSSKDALSTSTIMPCNNSVIKTKSFSILKPLNERNTMFCIENNSFSSVTFNNIPREHISVEELVKASRTFSRPKLYTDDFKRGTNTWSTNDDNLGETDDIYLADESYELEK